MPVVLPVFMCRSVCVGACLYLFVSVCFYVCLCINMYVHACVPACVPELVCELVYVCVSSFGGVSVKICGRAYVYMCVSVCVYVIYPGSDLSDQKDIFVGLQWEYILQKNNSKHLKLIGMPCAAKKAKMVYECGGGKRQINRTTFPSF